MLKQNIRVTRNRSGLGSVVSSFETALSGIKEIHILWKINEEPNSQNIFICYQTANKLGYLQYV